MLTGVLAAAVNVSVRYVCSACDVWTSVVSERLGARGRELEGKCVNVGGLKLYASELMNREFAQVRMYDTVRDGCIVLYECK